MFTAVYDKITFDNFCNIFKIYFNWTYTKLSEVLNCNERTLQRWRKYNKYHALDSSNYIILLHTFENTCKQNNMDPKKILIEFFFLPQVYVNESYENITKLIIYNLSIKLDNNDIASNEVMSTLKFDLKPYEIIANRLNGDKKIKSICMAFHSGWDWLKNSTKRRIIDKINDMGIKLNVISNDKKAIEYIAQSMGSCHMQKFYIGFDQGIHQWAICQNALKHLELRISSYPIMRKVYIINYQDNTYEMFLRNYIYDYSPEYEDEVYSHYSNLDENGKDYKREFNFLWNHALTYNKWRALNPIENDELLKPTEYILLYRKNNCKDEDIENRFIVSKLIIKDNNKITLEVNRYSKLTTPLITNKMEYLLNGTAKVTKYNIYITLYDTSLAEQINITLVRPLHECDRYIGIMVALTQSAHPIAYKCVCIQENMISNINIETILDVLNHNNQAWEDHLMIIEDRDSSIFYSNIIFKQS